MTEPVDEERTVDIECLDFNKVFDVIFHKILIENKLKYELDEQTVRWTENSLNNKPQRVMISGRKSNWTPQTISVLQRLKPGPIVFNIET